MLLFRLTRCVYFGFVQDSRDADTPSGLNIRAQEVQKMTGIPPFLAGKPHLLQGRNSIQFEESDNLGPAGPPVSLKGFKDVKSPYRHTLQYRVPAAAPRFGPASLTSISYEGLNMPVNNIPTVDVSGSTFKGMVGEGSDNIIQTFDVLEQKMLAFMTEYLEWSHSRAGLEPSPEMEQILAEGVARTVGVAESAYAMGAKIVGIVPHFSITAGGIGDGGMVALQVDPETGEFALTMSQVKMTLPDYGENVTVVMHHNDASSNQKVPKEPSPAALHDFLRETMYSFVTGGNNNSVKAAAQQRLLELYDPTFMVSGIEVIYAEAPEIGTGDRLAVQKQARILEASLTISSSSQEIVTMGSRNDAQTEEDAKPGSRDTGASDLLKKALKFELDVHKEMSAEMSAEKAAIYNMMKNTPRFEFDFSKVSAEEIASLNTRREPIGDRFSNGNGT